MKLYAILRRSGWHSGEELGEAAGRSTRVGDDDSVRNHPLVIEGDLHGVQSDRPVIVHHEGDLLRGPRMPSHPGKALLRRSFFPQHRTTPPEPWRIEA